MPAETSSGSDARKTKQQLIDELSRLRRQIDRLKSLESAVSLPEGDSEPYAEMVQNSPDAIISIGRDSRIRVFNQGAEQIFGYAAEEILGSPLDILVPESATEAFTRNMRAFFVEQQDRQHMSGNQIFSGQRRNGDVFTSPATISCTRGGDDTVLTLYLSDPGQISDFRHAAGQSLNDLARVGRIRMLGEIARSLAHELNQPLAAILTNSQVLRREVDSLPPDPELSKEIVSDIIDDAKRAGAIVERLRNHMRSANDRFSMLDVNSVVSNVKNWMQREFDVRQIVCQMNLVPDIPAVLGDPVQLQQVLLNIFSNALDAMEECQTKGRLIISTQAGGANTVEISVKDNGIGVEEEAMKHLFEPFYTTKKDGIGMGLNISRTIVEAHGGKIWADHGRIDGVNFYVSLPVAEKETATRTAAEAQANLPSWNAKGGVAGMQESHPTILIVDDDQSFRSALTRSVEASGFRTASFASADEFLARKPLENEGCLIVDLHMPGMTGLDLQAKLESHDEILPVIFITGAGDTASGVAAMKHGAVDFLKKPFDEAELLQVIGYALEKGQEQREQRARQVAAKSKLAKLTGRETEIMALVVTGMPNKQIAHALGIAEKTVKAHRGRVMRKTKAGSVPELVRIWELAADE